MTDRNGYIEYLEGRIADLEKQNAELAKALGIMVSRDAAMVPLMHFLGVPQK